VHFDGHNGVERHPDEASHKKIARDEIHLHQPAITVAMGVNVVDYHVPDPKNPRQITIPDNHVFEIHIIPYAYSVRLMSTDAKIIP
jgi:hypothetical protein